MTTPSFTMEANLRSVTGRKVRALRRNGTTPMHLYGKGTSSLNLQADTALLKRLVAQAGGNTPVMVSVNGVSGVHLSFIREVQRHPITNEILHVDFYQVPTTEVMRAEVPVYLTGEAPAIRKLSGVLLQALHSIEVECLPLDVPQAIEVDVSDLDDFEKAIHVSDISFGSSIAIVTSPDELVARVNQPRVTAEAAGEEVGGEGTAAAGEAAEVQP